MKKLLLIITSILCAITLVGCATTGTASSVFGGSYYLSDYENLGIGNLNETSVYRVTFAPSEASPENVAYDLDEGSYTTHAYVSEYEGKRCYRLDTTLLTKGTITVDGEATPFDDTVTTTAYFLGVDSALKPLFSSRSVKAHSLVYADNKYQALYYDYALKTTYGENDATVEFLPDNEASTGTYSLEEGTTEYKNVFQKTYLDNEVMLFAIRSFNLSTSFSASFDSVDSISKIKRTLSLSVAGSSTANSANTSAKETLDVTFTNGGEIINKVDTFKLNLMISGTYTGSTIVLNYSDRAEKKTGQQLIRMQTSLPFNMGTFTYLITSVAKY